MDLCNNSLDLDFFFENGWLVNDNYFSAAFSRILLQEINFLRREGEFLKAGIGKGISFQHKPEIRSDFVYWLDPLSPSPVQQEYLNKIDQIIQLFRESFFLPIQDYEAHYAVFPVGSFYKKHLDQFKEAGNRLLSCILYLNENWTDSDGGELRIYKNDGSSIEIKPELGRLLIFRSDLIEHEVLITNRERFSLTGWMRKETTGIINL